MTHVRGWVAAAVIGVLAAGGASAYALTRPDAGDEEPAREVLAVPSGPVERAPAAQVPALAWGPSVVDLAKAKVRAAELPLDVAAGQVIVAAISSPDPAAAAAAVQQLHLGGVIVMGPAVVDAAQVRALTQAVSDSGALDGRGWPAIVSVDQEGGTVARLRGVVEDLPGFMAAGAVHDNALVRTTYADAGAELVGLGFNIDWAPVADVTVGSADPVIGVRSAGDDAAAVTEVVDSAVAGYLDAGLLPAVKHFPGHGSVTVDSHEALPVQTSPVAALTQRDLLPFASAIDAGVPIVMLGHIAVPEWGGAASLSPAAYAYLRGELGFAGVTVTDALNMGAISGEPGQAEVAALAAGADLLLLPADPALASAAIQAAVANGTVPRERLDEAVARVSLLMSWQAQLQADATVTTPHAGYASAFAAKSIVVSGPVCSGPLVGSTVTISGGGAGERDALYAALAARGIGKGGGTTVRLLGSSSGTGSADVVVALDAPWGLPGSAATTYVGLFGRSDDALAALADVLAGTVTAGGVWPVAGMPTACTG